MKDKKVDINPQTKIGEMLDIYPQLEETLLSISPSFAKLKNPILRKTVARVATLGQVAQMGGISIGGLISVLRKAAGMSDDAPLENELSETINVTRPDWVDDDNLSTTFDASSVIESGGNPMASIIERAEKLEDSEVMLLVSPFTPTPMIELLTSKGFAVWYEEKQAKIYTYIKKTG